jgi:hypothetical protein|tara:strand:- start:3883 stop:4221 length:339 start_codon:yes stop_codon:yes gene_type:complete
MNKIKKVKTKEISVYCAVFCGDDGEQVEPFGTMKVDDDYEEDMMFGTCDECYEKVEEASKECFDCSESRRILNRFDRPLRMRNGDPQWVCGETHRKPKYCKTIKWLEEKTDE